MPETFGKRLKELRKKSGLTQEQLADCTGYSLMTIRRWEWGERTPRLEEIKALAKALGVSEADLLHDPPEHSGGWELHLKILDSNPTEVMNLIAPVKVESFIGTTPSGGYLVLGGDYSLWEDDSQFKKIVAQLKKMRDSVIQQGKHQRG